MSNFYADESYESGCESPNGNNDPSNHTSETESENTTNDNSNSQIENTYNKIYNTS